MEPIPQKEAKAVKCHFDQIPLPKLVVGRKEGLPQL